MKLFKNKNFRFGFFMALGWLLFFVILIIIKNVASQKKSDKENNQNNYPEPRELSFIPNPVSFPDSIYYCEEIISPAEVNNYLQNKKFKKISNHDDDDSFHPLKGSYYISVKRKKNSSEIFFGVKANGVLQYTLFVDSQKIYFPFANPDPNNETDFQTLIYPTIFTINDTSLHHILFCFKRKDKTLENNLSSTGKKFTILTYDFNALVEQLIGLFFSRAIPFCLFLGLFAISILHLMLYWFYKKNKTNLYYFISILFFSIIFLSLFIITKNINFFQYTIFPVFLIIGSSGFLIFIIRTYYELFHPVKSLFLFRLLIIVFILIILSYFLISGVASAFLISFLILFYCVESFRMMYFALLRKPKGYLIILTGMIIFSALLLYIFISIFINHNIQISTASGALLFFVCLLIIPLTMSIYLAYSFGIINQELEKKLHEVRILSEENIRKEKEKQEILRNQNLLLEEQVKERTREIELQKNIIEEKNKDIMDSINYATRIQNSILVPEKELASITGDAFVIFYPKDILSGDFYTMHRSGDSIFVIAADCTGHGVPGALMSMIGNTLIHKIIHEMQIHSPGKILEMLHQELRKNLKQDSQDSESKDGMDVAVVRIQNNIITYAGANRPLLFISKDNSLQQIRPTKTSIGGNHLSVIQVEEHAMEIKNIQRIFLFSDGFTDQFGGPNQKKISSSRLKEWIQQTIGKKGYEIKEELNRKFLEWKGQTEQTDDVLMLSIGFSS